MTKAKQAAEAKGISARPRSLVVFKAHPALLKDETTPKLKVDRMFPTLGASFLSKGDVKDSAGAMVGLDVIGCYFRRWPSGLTGRSKMLCVDGLR